MKSFSILKIAGFMALAIVLGFVIMRALAGQGLSEDNTFFSQFVIAGGPIVWFIQIPLSIITVYLLVEQTLTIRRKRLLPSANLLSAIRHNGFKQLPAAFAHTHDMVSTAVKRALSCGAISSDDLMEAASASLQEQAASILRKVEWHNIIGNISPMLGLLGTVIGMISTFSELGAANGQSHPSQLAHGISIAWVTTFWGLLVAIPALAAHGIFRNRLESIAADAASQTEKLLTDLRRPESGAPKQLAPAALNQSA